MDRAEEIRAWGSLAGDGLAEVVGIVEDVHATVARRFAAFLPPVAAPISRLVAASTAATYTTVRTAHRWIPRAATALAAARSDPVAPPLSEQACGHVLLATVNGLWGPSVTDGRGLTIPMALSDGTAAHPPQVASHVVVFIHGLVESSRSWGPVRHPDGTTSAPYPQQLAVDTDATTFVLDYSTGRGVADNGEQLSSMLGAVLDGWPVELDSVTLVGHSMGGLVARSAAHQAHETGRGWVRRLRLIVTLGSPHLGAPLEKSVHAAERAIARFPESAPIARLLAGRSPGVRDLRHGRILEDIGGAQAGDPEPVPGVTYCTVSGAVTHSPAHPFGLLVGDGMVRLPSASGRSRTRHLSFDVDVRLGGTSHQALLAVPPVYDLLRRWVQEYAVDA